MQQFTNIARLASDSRFRKESAVFFVSCIDFRFVCRLTIPHIFGMMKRVKYPTGACDEKKCDIPDAVILSCCVPYCGMRARKRNERTGTAYADSDSD